MRISDWSSDVCSSDLDEAALAEALKAGQIAGAGFDVVTKEPVPADHPFMALMGRPDFILTPHVAWAGREAIQALSDQLIDNIEAYAAGKPRNVVTGRGLARDRKSTRLNSSH